MAGFLGDDQVRRVKAAVDLVQLMGEYAPLRKSGRNFTCCCPFHQERTPSCHIYPDQQTYHCYGCGAHGDAITLVRERERLEFTEAVELLARRAGLRLEWQQGGPGQRERGERDELLKAVAFAADFYQRRLWEADDAAEARAYLERRRLSRATCDRFRVGWAPGAGQLVEAAARAGIPAERLARCDLAVERAGRLADRFFERIAFPICDRFGNPVAFSARLLPEAERAAKEAGRGVGKYVNCTETPLYRKSAVVFNLHHARLASRDAGRLIVMEGPTDVMAADQAGVRECVAVLGTALTGEHARQLGNLVGATGRLVILLDGDAAGQANSLKAVRTCLAAGVPVRIATLPDELDPAELLAEGQGGGDPRARFEAVVAQARQDNDHLLRTLAPRPHELDARRRVQVVDQVLEALRPMADPELRRLHLREAAEWLGLEAERLERRLAGPPAPAERQAGPEEDAPEPAPPPLEPAQEAVLHLLVRCPALRPAAFDELGLEPGFLPAPWDVLGAALQLHPDLDHHGLAALPEVGGAPGLGGAVLRWAAISPRERFRPGAGAEEDAADPELRRELELRLADLRTLHLRAELARLRREISEAEKAGDLARARALFEEQGELRRRLG